MNMQSKISCALKQYNEQDKTNKNDKLKITKRSFRFGKDNRFCVSIANNYTSRQEAYEMIYTLYSSKEIDYVSCPDPSKMWYSIYNASPFTQTVNVIDTISNKLVGTLTVVIDSALGLPLEEQYSYVLDEFRTKGRNCFEIISLGVANDTRDSVEILNHLFAFSYYIAKGYYGGTDYLIMIKPSHATFYEKRLLFKKIADEVVLKKINNKSVALYHLPVELIEHQAKKSLDIENNKNGELYKTYWDTLNDDIHMNQLFEMLHTANLSLVELVYFFINKKDVFYRIEPRKIKALANLYRSIEIQDFLFDLCNEKSDLLILN